MGSPNIAHGKLKELMAQGAHLALKAQQEATWQRTIKSDGTPVTTLDLELHELFSAKLPQILDVPVVSEEGAWERQGGLSRFWCVDPLDGTRHFIQGSRDFALCVALIWEGYPVVGALTGPAWGQSFYAHDGRLECNGEAVPPPQGAPSRERVALTSGAPSERLSDLFFHLGIERHERRGSVIKLAHLAQGTGHFYPRFGITREWDTAAGQAVLEAQGGTLVDMNFERLKYGKPEFLNRGFMAWGPQTFTPEEVEKLRELVGKYARR